MTGGARPALAALYLGSLLALGASASEEHTAHEAREEHGERERREQHRPWTGAGLDAQAGRALFDKLWVSAPSSTRASDGLGPYYHARSCAACHPGGGGAAPQSLPTGLVIFLPERDAHYGWQLQDRAVPGLSAEVQLDWRHEEELAPMPGQAPLALPRPRINFQQGEPPTSTRLSPRIAPPLAGIALFDQIAEADILAWADPEDQDGDGISGRAGQVSSTQAEERIGRYGWRAGEAGLREQAARALALDLGIGNPLYPAPYGDCSEAQQACRGAPHGGDGEDGGDGGDGERGLEAAEVVLDLLVAYLRSLPAPSSRGAANAPGRRLFESSGCTACHRPSFTLGNGREIQPWSDLLLHDMGPGLADYDLSGRALPSEWRTAPLWGLGKRELFLHDGRTSDLTEAILWHDGEAAAARARFLALDPTERELLLDFLRGL